MAARFAPGTPAGPAVRAVVGQRDQEVVTVAVRQKGWGGLSLQEVQREGGGGD